MKLTIVKLESGLFEHQIGSNNPIYSNNLKLDIQGKDVFLTSKKLNESFSLNEVFVKETEIASEANYETGKELAETLKTLSYPNFNLAVSGDGTIDPADYDLNQFQNADNFVKQSELPYINKIINEGTLVTNTTNETTLFLMEVDANSLLASDIFKYNVPVSHIGTGGGVVYKLKISDTNTMPTGSTGQVATYTHGQTTQTFEFERTFKIKGGNLTGLDKFFSASTDKTAFPSSSISSTPFTVGVKKYVFLTATPASLTDSVQANYGIIKNF